VHGSANEPDADLVPAWRPRRSPSRRGRDLNAEAVGAEVSNLSAAVGAEMAKGSARYISAEVAAYMPRRPSPMPCFVLLWS
jgi:hypothetical protein